MIIGICDDNKKDANELETEIEGYMTIVNIPFEIHVFNSIPGLMACLDQIPFDCLFLDIYVGEENGMTVASTLRENEYSNSIVFTTTSKEHVFDSFLVNPVDYLIKPIDPKRLQIVIEKLRKLYSPAYLLVKTNLGNEQISVHDIYYIETKGNHQLSIHSKKNSITTSTPMNELEKLLKQYTNFFRCHRSYIINMNYVDSIQEFEVKLINGDKALLSIRNVSQFRKEILQYLMYKK